MRKLSSLRLSDRLIRVSERLSFIYSLVYIVDFHCWGTFRGHDSSILPRYAQSKILSSFRKTALIIQKSHIIKQGTSCSTEQKMPCFFNMSSLMNRGVFIIIEYLMQFLHIETYCLLTMVGSRQY